jgi:hypothetical protein
MRSDVAHLLAHEFVADLSSTMIHEFIPRTPPPTPPALVRKKKNLKIV